MVPGQAGSFGCGASGRQRGAGNRRPGGAGPGAALAFARSAASGYLLSPSANGSGSTASTVQIIVSGHVPTIVPGLVVTVTEAAQAPVEKFTAP